MWFGWILRALIALLIVRAIWRFLSGVVDGAAGQQRIPPQRGVPLVRDPVCGTFVDQSRALTARRGGTLHYFCSERCRGEYERVRS